MQTEGLDTKINNPTISVAPRRVIPRLVFWPLLLLLFLLAAGSAFVFLDRQVWRQHWSEVLPAETEFLTILPANKNNALIGVLENVLARIPAGDDYLNAEAEELIKSTSGYAGIDEVGAWLASVGNDSNIILAKIEAKNLLVLTNFNPPQNSGVSSASENYNGEEIYTYAGSTTSPVFAWLSGGSLFTSPDKNLITGLIELKHSRQYSRRENWPAQKKNLALAQNQLFRQTYQKLSSESVMRFYLNTAKPGASAYLSSALSVLAPKTDLNSGRLSEFSFTVGNAADIEKLDGLAMAIKATDEGLTLELVQKEKSPVPASVFTHLLSDVLPKSLRGINLDTFVQVNNLGGRMSRALTNLESDSEQRYQEVIQALSTYEINLSPQQLSFLNGRAAVAAGLDQSGAPLVIFVADNTDSQSAQALGEAMTDNFRALAVDPGFELTEKYLIAGTSRAAVLDLSRVIGGTADNLSQILPEQARGKQDVFFFLSTRVLSRLGRAITQAGGEADLWQAVDILTEAVPLITFSSHAEEEVFVSELFMQVKNIPPHRKNEAEKILDRLDLPQQNANSSLTVRDSTRRADLTIIESVINEFKRSQSRAPVTLSELVPTYLSVLPVDPLSRQPYPYSNNGADNSFYLLITLEGDSSLGPPGNYCMGSLGLIYSSSGECQEN